MEARSDARVLELNGARGPVRTLSTGLRATDPEFADVRSKSMNSGYGERMTVPGGDGRLSAAAGNARRSVTRALGGATYLQKWIILGVLIGVVAGLGAIVFYWLLSRATGLLLVDLGGYTPPKPVGEGGGAAGGIGFSDFSRPWAIPLVVGGGALASALLVFTFAPEAEGHGTDAAIAAIHKNPRQIKVRTVVVKIVASALTIGSGGSGGREGPTAQISAGFASVLARYLDLRPADGRIAVGVGIGSGIGAIFGAPLGGAVLSASIAYKNDFDARVLIPGFITSITAYAVFGSVEGYRPLFGDATSGYVFDDPTHLVWFAIIGVLAGAVGIAYSRTFYATARLTKRLPGSGRPARIAKATVGGILVGLLALAVPQVLGSGYGWAQMALDRSGLMSLPLWLVLVLPLAKILATALSIGSGGSGGIFGPGMVIGAFVGGAVWRVLEALDAPSVPDTPAVFVIVGMMACFGSVARVPLAVMLMVGEMTGGYTVLVPAMLAVGLAYLIVRQAGDTIYSEQVDSRETEYAARVDSALPLLDRVPVHSVVSAAPVMLSSRDTWGEAGQAMRAAGACSAPVTDAGGRFVGVLSADRGAGIAAGSAIGHAIDRAAAAVRIDDNLDDALAVLPPAVEADRRWVAVVDGDRVLCGVVTVHGIVRGYRSALHADATRFHGVSASADVTDIPVGEGAAIVGAEAAGPAVPDEVIVLSILRGGVLLPGADSAIFQAGDVVTALGPTRRLAEFRDRAIGADKAKTATT